MKLEELIDEKIYQEFKCKMNKDGDYWFVEEIEKIIQYRNDISKDIDFFIN